MIGFVDFVAALWHYVEPLDLVLLIALFGALSTTVTIVTLTGHLITGVSCAAARAMLACGHSMVQTTRWCLFGPQTKVWLLSAVSVARQGTAR